MIALQERIRSPVVEGMFYPEDRAKMRSCIKSFGLERGRGGHARVIIAPHGAWEISGLLAAAAFGAAAGGSPSRVVIMGPIRDRRGDGLFLSNSHSFETPLGTLPVDQEISETLESCGSPFKVNDIPHLQEHSIEVLLPFVKYCFPRASIVPVLMARQREAVIAALAQALKTVIAPIMEDTLLVLSFNLSSNPSQTAALGMAEECMRLIYEKKAVEFGEALSDGRLNTFGGGLVAGLLQSGLVDAMRPVPLPILQARGEKNTILYYGALSFE